MFTSNPVRLNPISHKQLKNERLLIRLLKEKFSCYWFATIVSCLDSIPFPYAQLLYSTP